MSEPRWYDPGYWPESVIRSLAYGAIVLAIVAMALRVGRFFGWL